MNEQFQFVFALRGPFLGLHKNRARRSPLTYVYRCPICDQPETVISSCRNCYDPPVFTMLGGTLMLAKSLLVHYGVDPGKHPGVVAQLDGEIGEELLK